tara:strand:+ start:4680 stop:5534 length:855 start_codon:yes stop_codon:yes gene_type:complete
MRIVNTFISDTNEIPAYVEISLRQARKMNPGLEIDFISKKAADYFEELSINWIPQDDITHPMLDEFRRLSWFDSHGTPNTTYPSPAGFWQKTCERIYYVMAHVYNNNYKKVFHFENDVLLYGNLKELEPIGETAKVTDMSPTQTTFAFCYFPNAEQIAYLCLCFNHLLTMGNYELQEFVNDHISEMSLAKIMRDVGTIESFPILPQSGQSFLFDPGSYGQFLGGTNNGHDGGFTDPKHYIGQAINNGLQVSFVDDKPYVVHKEVHYPLFNLHVHSKNLGEFIGV